MGPLQEGKSSTLVWFISPDFIFLVVFLLFFKTGSWQLQSQEEDHDYPVCLQQAVRTELVFILTTSLQRGQERCCPRAHSLCTQQVNMFRGYFLLKQIGGGQYNMLQPLKSERCWFPQRLYCRASAQSSFHHMPHGHHSVHYHFTPSLEERPVWANPSSWLLVSRWNLSQPIPPWQYAETSPASQQLELLVWVVELSPVPCCGEKHARLTTRLQSFWQSPQDVTAWESPHHPPKMYL